MGEPSMSGTRDPKARYDIGALEQRVFSTEKALSDIQSSISALGTKIDERSRTPWTTLISAFGFLLAFMTTVGVLAYRPLDATDARHESRLNQIDERYRTDMQREIDRLRAEAMIRK